MNMTCILFGGIFVAAGALFYFGRGHTRLWAFKQMTDEEKKAIAIGPLCRNVGSMIALCGLIFLAAGLWEPFKERAFTWCIIGWLVLSGADVYLIGKGRYQ